MKTAVKAIVATKSKVVEAPDYTSVFTKEGEQRRFRQLVLSRQEAIAKRDELAAEIAATTEAIQAFLNEDTRKSAMVDFWRVTLTAGRKGSSKIDLEVLRKKGVTDAQIGKAATGVDVKRLVQAGVSTKVVTKATVTGPPGEPHVTISDVTKERGKKEGGSDE